MLKDEEGYSPLRPSTEHDASDGNCESVGLIRSQQDPSSRKKSTRKQLLLGIGVLLISNIASLFLGGLLGRRTVDLDSSCAAYTAQYSPVLKDVDIKYSFTHFNGSFMQQEIYRLPGSPAVDAAWEALGVDYRAGVIPAEEGQASGLTEAHVQRSEQYGGGYFVNVEGMHHLHCLNLVRKSVYYNYQYYKDLGTHAFKNDEDILQLHISHCVDIIRQVLMCNVDTGVLGQVWADKDKPVAFPDFNTRHKCKNYDAVRQWAEKLQAPPPTSLPSDYLKRPDPRYIMPGTP